MKKEYIAVSGEQVLEDEIEFVEDFWTQQWEKKVELPKVEAVTRRDEYRIMQRYLCALPQGGRILDGGCGVGAWTVLLARQGFDVTGLDISEPTIARLKTVLPEQRFICGDLRRTNFPDASFDAYFSWGAFEHFEDGLGPCISEAHRVLKPGGFLFISVPFDNWWYILRDARLFRKFAFATNGNQPQRFYQWRFTKTELAHELAMRGFRVHQVSPISKRQGVTRWLRWNFPSLTEGKFLFSFVRRLLVPVMPRAYASHMILAVAQKDVKKTLGA